MFAQQSLQPKLWCRRYASVSYALQNNTVFRRAQNWVSVSDGSRTDNGSEFQSVGRKTRNSKTSLAVSRCSGASMEQATDGTETAAIDGLVSSWSENISISFCLRVPGYGLTLWCALGLLVEAQYKCLSYSYRNSKTSLAVSRCSGASSITSQKLSVCVLTMLHPACTDLLMNSNHKPKTTSVTLARTALAFRVVHWARSTGASAHWRGHKPSWW